jgi:chromate transporter
LAPTAALRDSALSEAAAPPDGERAAEPPSLLAIARTFGTISATAFGGGQMSAIRRAVVKRNGWLTEDEFLGLLSVAQILPGANPTNVAVLVAGKLRGPLGAATALLSAVLPGFLILLVIAYIALTSHQPVLMGALRGCAAVAVGLTFANAIEMTLPRRTKWVDLLLVLVTAASVIVLHTSLFVTLLVFVPVAVLVTRPEPEPVKKNKSP